ncbi:hypothetical protein KAJ27_08610, partial [bacterium]|nr:hypothetical protein [bacterium]
GLDLGSLSTSIANVPWATGWLTGICYDDKDPDPTKKGYWLIDWQSNPKKIVKVDTSFNKISEFDVPCSDPIGIAVSDLPTDNYLYINTRGSSIYRCDKTGGSVSSINMNLATLQTWFGQGITIMSGEIYAGTGIESSNAGVIYVVDTWPVTPDEGVIKVSYDVKPHLGEISGLANKDGKIYACSRYEPHIIEFDPDVLLETSGIGVTIEYELPKYSNNGNYVKVTMSTKNKTASPQTLRFRYVASHLPESGEWQNNESQSRAHNDFTTIMTSKQWLAFLPDNKDDFFAYFSLDDNAVLGNLESADTFSVQEKNDATINPGETHKFSFYIFSDTQGAASDPLKPMKQYVEIPGISLGGCESSQPTTIFISKQNGASINLTPFGHDREDTQDELAWTISNVDTTIINANISHQEYAKRFSRPKILFWNFDDPTTIKDVFANWGLPHDLSTDISPDTGVSGNRLDWSMIDRDSDGTSDYDVIVFGGKFDSPTSYTSSQTIGGSVDLTSVEKFVAEGGTLVGLGKTGVYVSQQAGIIDITNISEDIVPETVVLFDATTNITENVPTQYPNNLNGQLKFNVASNVRKIATISSNSLNTSLEFNGMDNSMTIPDPTGLNGKIVAFEAWVRFNNFADEHQLCYIECPGIGSARRYFYFSTWRPSGWTTGHDGIHIGTLTTAGSWGRGFSNDGADSHYFEKDIWTHIYGCVNTVTGTIKVYKNGVKVVEMAIPTGDIPGTPSKIWFGGTPEAYQHADCLMDEIRVLDYELTDDEIMTDYMSGGNYPSREGQLCWFHLDENTGTTAFDISGKNQHATISGAQWTTRVPVKNTTAIIGAQKYKNGLCVVSGCHSDMLDNSSSYGIKNPDQQIIYNSIYTEANDTKVSVLNIGSNMDGYAETEIEIITTDTGGLSDQQTLKIITNAEPPRIVSAITHREPQWWDAEWNYRFQVQIKTPSFSEYGDLYDAVVEFTPEFISFLDSKGIDTSIILNPDTGDTQGFDINSIRVVEVDVPTDGNIILSPEVMPCEVKVSPRTADTFDDGTFQGWEVVNSPASSVTVDGTGNGEVNLSCNADGWASIRNRKSYISGDFRINTNVTVTSGSTAQFALWAPNYTPTFVEDTGTVYEPGLLLVQRTWNDQYLGSGNCADSRAEFESSFANEKVTGTSIVSNISVGPGNGSPLSGDIK